MEKTDLKKEIINTDGTDGLEPPKISLRWLLCFLGSCNYFITVIFRNSLSVAIIAMVNTTKSSEDDYNSSYACRVAEEYEDDTSYSNEIEFDWNSSVQGLILGGFFWGYFIGRILGGRFGELFGQRETIAYGMGICGVLELLSPLSARLSPYALLTVRFFMGLFIGPISPILASLVSKWALRSQLSTTFVFLYAGAPLGALVGLETAGWIVEGLGWQWMFYIQGILPFIWIPLWWIFVRNDPADHPMISDYEAALLSENKNVTTKKIVPWKEILTCPYLYVCVFAQFARSWLDTMQATVGPLFFNKKIGLELSKASLVCAVACFLSLPAMLIYGRSIDFFIKNKYLPTLLARRIYHGIGTIGSAIIFISIIISGCNIPGVVSSWLLFGVVMSAQAVSISVSIVDFAPNFAGTLSGILGIGNGFAAICPVVISALVKYENGWNYAFWISVLVCLISFVLYSLIMTDKPLPWNYYDNGTQNCEDNSESQTQIIQPKA